VYLNIVPVWVEANGKEFITNAFLDQGSSTTLCDEKLLELLGVPRERVTFTLTTVNKTSERQQGFKASLSVAPLHENRYVRLPNVFSVKGLPIVCPPAPSTEALKRWRHLDGVTFPEQTSKEVLLLIGLDVPEVFWSLEERRGKPDERYAVRTVLGWSLIGPRPDSKASVCVNHVRVGDKLLERQVAKLWQLEATPIAATKEGLSKEDRYTLSLMKQSKSGSLLHDCPPFRSQVVAELCEFCTTSNRQRQLK